MNRIMKSGDAYVPLGYFLERDKPEISAVMFSVFSNVATSGKVAALITEPDSSLTPYFTVARMNGRGETVVEKRIPKSRYTEGLLDGLHVFHNPRADYHFSQETFDFEGVAQWGLHLRTRVPFRVGTPTILLHRGSLTPVRKRRRP